MKRLIFLISVITILNGCAQSTSLMGPSYTLAKSGSIVQAGNSIAMSYGVKKAINEPVVKNMMDGNPRECETVHSSELNKVFFNTLDEFNCYVDPFSILK